MSFDYQRDYKISPAYDRCIAYFCMEYAIHQSLKLYAGGLGFLSGSHLRSAYALRQNMIGIGILWKYGYYDQVRKPDQTMDVLYMEKLYGYLERTDIRFTIRINNHDVHVVVWYLPPEVFKTAPLFLLSTDSDENDYLAKTISHNLYSSNPETSAAAAILLGAGGARLLEHLNIEPDVYHLNENHGLPLAFYLLNRFRDLNAVKKRLLFTNHNPEPPGSKMADIFMLDKIGFFCGLPMEDVRKVTGESGHILDLPLTAFRMAGLANGVSKAHAATLNKLWGARKDICEISSVTNAQCFNYWSDDEMYKAVWNENFDLFGDRKRKCKKKLFEEVADQNGEMYDPQVLTIVFAKRFANYKRPDLLLRNMDRFDKIVNNRERPVQVIWAGKPYPMDYNNIAVFNKVVEACKLYSNCSILVGYELKLSKLLKAGADVWLNVPRLGQEASGTSGMSAAMNGAVNVSIPDGWFPEFIRDQENGFTIKPAKPSPHVYEQDDEDANNMYDLLEEVVIPMYYNDPIRWQSIVAQSMQDVMCAFDSERMVIEYYNLLYSRLNEPASIKSIEIANSTSP
ncbi:alpha-glucan family phosphorylase [Pseudoflavitalea rhizosphaerae]|uniref:alpha-glucan family phosphorylase n=1 Tax=Pseudoflavitalea rhizosphaerae TaxID=1884793 RepID=UPI000F8CD959|nr:alpha-glucan family phosphorylase [Pseudoflavitalea rhizosphaerae]